MASRMEMSLTKKRKKMLNKACQLATMAGYEEFASSSTPFSDKLVSNESPVATCLVALRVSWLITCAVAMDTD
jgi:hypothetical protein